jgi:hypothetical protein
MYNFIGPILENKVLFQSQPLTLEMEHELLFQESDNASRSLSSTRTSKL